MPQTKEEILREMWGEPAQPAMAVQPVAPQQPVQNRVVSPGIDTTLDTPYHRMLAAQQSAPAPDATQPQQEAPQVHTDAYASATPQEIAEADKTTGAPTSLRATASLKLNPESRLGYLKARLGTSNVKPVINPETGAIDNFLFRKDPQGQWTVYDPRPSDSLLRDIPGDIADEYGTAEEALGATLGAIAGTPGGPAAMMGGSMAGTMAANAMRQGQSALLPGEDAVTPDQRAHMLAQAGEMAVIGQGAGTALGAGAKALIKGARKVASPVYRNAQNWFGERVPKIGMEALLDKGQTGAEIAQEGLALQKRAANTGIGEIPLSAAQLSQTRKAAGLQEVLENNPKSQTIMDAFNSDRTKGLALLADRTIDAVSKGEVGAVEAVNRASAAYEGYMQQLMTARAEQARQLFGAAQLAAKGQKTFGLQNTIKALDTLEEQQAGVGPQAAQATADYIAAIRKKFVDASGTSWANLRGGNEALTPQQFQKTLELWGKAAQSGDSAAEKLDRTATSRIAKMIFGALNQDMDAAIVGEAKGAPRQISSPLTKIVNKDGLPKTLYHGTGGDFTANEFDPAMAGTNTGYYGSDKAFFFHDNENDAGYYAALAVENIKAKDPTLEPVEKIIAVNVNSKRPLVLGLSEKDSSVSKKVLDTIADDDKEAINYAKIHNYDSVVWPYGNPNNSGYTVAVWEPSKISEPATLSASGSNGTSNVALKLKQARDAYRSASQVIDDSRQVFLDKATQLVEGDRASLAPNDILKNRTPEEVTKMFNVLRSAPNGEDAADKLLGATMRTLVDNSTGKGIGNEATAEGVVSAAKLSSNIFAARKKLAAALPDDSTGKEMLKDLLAFAERIQLRGGSRTEPLRQASNEVFVGSGESGSKVMAFAKHQGDKAVMTLLQKLRIIQTPQALSKAFNDPEQLKLMIQLVGTSWYEQPIDRASMIAGRILALQGVQEPEAKAIYPETQPQSIRGNGRIVQGAPQ
jgi:hypothetical protein